MKNNTNIKIPIETLKCSLGFTNLDDSIKRVNKIVILCKLVVLVSIVNFGISCWNSINHAGTIYTNYCCISFAIVLGSVWFTAIYKRNVFNVFFTVFSKDSKLNKSLESLGCRSLKQFVKRSRKCLKRRRN